MKTLSFVVVSICLAVLTVLLAHAQDTNKPADVFMNLVNVPVGEVLDAYKGYSGQELVIATDVPLKKQGITLPDIHASRDAVAPLIEQALLKQTGVIITRLDGKRASVTYNDRLPLQQ